MSKKPPLKDVADHLATYGRHGDSEIVHLNPIEVRALEMLSPTGKLTTNPVTGQKEAFLPFLAPIIGQMLGPALFAKLGMTAMSPLIASSLGAGLGSLAATRDPKQALTSGLLSFGLGGIGGKMASAARNGGNAAALAANASPSAAALGVPSASKEVIQGVAKAAPTIGRAGGALNGAQAIFRDPKAALATAIANPKYGASLAAGAVGLADQMKMPKTALPTPEKPKDIPENFPRERRVKQVSDPYSYGRPGSGGEFQFFDPVAGTPAGQIPGAPQATGGVSLQDLLGASRYFKDARRYAGGGPVGRMAGGGLADMKPDIGLLKGPGDGQSDDIPAKDTGGQDYLLADGEYVVPADAVSALGNGSTDAGARELDAMIARIRKSYYGSESQPSLKDKSGVLAT